MYICGMNKELSSFIITLGMAASVLILADIGLNAFMPELHPFKYGSLIIVLMFLVYVVSHVFLLRISEKEPKKFINAYMAFSGIKLMVLAILIVIIFMAYKEYMKESAVIMILSYILFTWVEWSYSKKILNPKK